MRMLYLAFHIVLLINNIYLSENLLNFRDMVHDLVGSGEAFITVSMWLSEICLLLSQHLILAYLLRLWILNCSRRGFRKTNANLLRPNNYWIICLP